MYLFDKKEYVNQVLTDVVLEEGLVDNIEFEGCEFKHCKLTGTTFRKVRFIDCHFSDCDFSLVKLPGAKFSEVVFKNCKLAGVNWTELTWPLVKLTSPIQFYSCNVSHSSFYSLDLPELIMEECKAHDVDFREANLNHASFQGTDLLNSQFMRTNLKAANFSQAIHYGINPNENNIKQAHFSFPDVVELLHYFEINIEGLPE